MQVEQEQSQDKVIAALRHQVDELTENNLLLKEQVARKEQFTAMIAHELRSPLTPIINYAQIVARPNQRRETIERGTNIIISQAWRLARLVSDLLDSSRLSSGHFSLTRASCDAVALVKEVVEQLRPVAPYHRFAVETPDAPVVGNWDCDRLQQALGNLVDNAIKYSDEDTTITVRAAHTPGKMHMHFAGRVRGAHRDGGVFIGVFDGVINKIAQGLLESITIPVAHDGGVRCLDCETVVGRDGAQLLYHFLDEGDGVTGGACQRKMPGRETRGVEQIAYQACQSPGLADDDVGAALDGFATLVGTRHNLGIVDDGGEWAAQLMSNHGRKLLFTRKLLL